MCERDVVTRYYRRRGDGLMHVISSGCVHAHQRYVSRPDVWEDVTDEIEREKQRVINELYGDDTIAPENPIRGGAR